MAKNSATKRTTKKDLDEKISELERKILQLSEQIEAQAPLKTEEKPKEKAEPKSEAKEPEVKIKEHEKAEVEAKTQPETKAQEQAPKLAEAADTQSKNFEALEGIYQNSNMTNPFDYKTKTPGYSPAPNRYYERLHARGTTPTSDWNLQKSKVTGYTAPSNQYFATRQRLAYHLPAKRFDGFSLSIDSSTSSEQTPPTEAKQETKIQESAQPEKKPITQTSGKEMTKEVAESLVGQKLDVLLYGDHHIGTLASVNSIDDKVFLRVNLQKGSLGMLIDDIKEWSIMQND